MTTSGGISRAIVGPDANVHPCWDQQLCDQPSDLVFMWEDPQPQYYTAYGWSPFDSLENFRYQIQLMRTNFWNWALGTMFGLGPILPLSLVGSGVMALIYWSDPEGKYKYGWVFLTTILYASGYMLTFSAQFRYYFPVLPILMGCGYLLLQKIFEGAREKLPPKKLVTFNVSMVMIFLISVLGLGGLDLVVYLLSNEYDSCEKEAAAVVEEFLEAPIAGTDPIVNYLSYYTRVPTVGALSTGLSTDEVDTTLSEFGVRTLICALDSDLASSLSSKFSYDPLLEVEICEHDYVILRLPQ
jgi:hypothetical protein